MTAKQRGNNWPLPAGAGLESLPWFWPMAALGTLPPNSK